MVSRVQRGADAASLRHRHHGAGASVLARRAPVDEARCIQRRLHPDAAAFFLAGSSARGEASAHSDLDLVIVYERLEHAYRQSFLSEGWPVETFVHDEETLRYFFSEVDGRAGLPSLARMVDEGIELPGPSPVSQALKQLARAHLAAGPPPWSEAELRLRRYVITDLVDDLRAPRSAAERVATAARLYDSLAEGLLRARGHWSARGKSIPRALSALDATLSARYVAAFERLFAGGESDAVIALCVELLQPLGGMLFDGFRLDAPPSWRRR